MFFGQFFEQLAGRFVVLLVVFGLFVEPFGFILEMVP
jgi:hypothetical protein